MRSIVNTLSLVRSSLLNRRATALLTIASIAVSVALLSGVNRVRTDTQSSFTNTISGTDLIVGARAGELNLLLYSVFRIGNPTNNIRWTSYQELANRPEVAWTIPISLGDAHRGYRVLGTDANYFDHYQYADERTLSLASGSLFDSATDAVIGAEVAAELGYSVGQNIVISHGIAEKSFTDHGDNPFAVSGILARTGTPVDRTVHISLAGMDLIHDKPGTEDHNIADYTPKEITAALVGLKSRVAIFATQRFVNENEAEPLVAIIPGVALKQLWDMVGIAEYALLGVSAMVVLAGALGLLTTFLVSLNERRREMSVLRSVGAGPLHVFSLLVCEAAILGLAGAATGLLILQIAIVLTRDWILESLGIQLKLGLVAFDFYVLIGIVTLAAIVSVVPAWRAYRNSLSDGLTVRV